MEFVLNGRFITGFILGLVVCYYYHARMAKKG